MRRAALLLPVVVASAAAIACTGGGAPARTLGQGDGGGVTWTMTTATLAVHSAWLDARWDVPTGSLVGLRSAKTGIEYLDGRPGPALTAVVDPATRDRWVAVGRLAAGGTPSIAVRPDGDGVTVDLAFADVGARGVAIVQHAHVGAQDEMIRWRTDVAVDPSATAVVVSVASPAIVGVNERANETLAWPWHEGTLIAQPASTPRHLVYPVPASMAWMHLYDPSGGVMLAAFDVDTQYKVLHFGIDPAIVGPLDPRRAMAIELAPWSEPSESWTSPEIALGVADHAGWTWAADRYRAWLAGSGLLREPSPFVQRFHGWRSAADKTPAKSFTYCDVPTKLFPSSITTDTGGIAATFLYGWHKDGLDTFYPDYDYRSDTAACLTKTDLEAAVHTLHDREQSVFFYLNARLVDEQSRFFARGGDAAASLAKAQDGSKYVEGGVAGRPLAVVCPSSPAWREQMLSKASELRGLDRGNGADGLWLDQLMEANERPCFDRTHGHHDPTSAFVEGYRRLLADARSRFDADGRPYLFAAEGIADAYAPWIDVAGLMWQRNLGYASPRPCFGVDDGEKWPCGNVTQAPQMTRFTIPTKVLGLPEQGAARGSKDEMAWALLLGNPLKIPSYPAKVNGFAFPRYPRIYDAEPSIYYDGTFEDYRGLAVDPTPTLRASGILGAAGDRVGVQLWNPTDATIHATATLTPRKIDRALGAPAAARDVESGEAIALTANGDAASFAVDVPAHDVRAVVVTLSR